MSTGRANVNEVQVHKVPKGTHDITAITKAGL